MSAVPYPAPMWTSQWAAALSLCLCAWIALGLPPSDDAADSWPGYRGPNADGHSPAVDLPTSWSEEENLVWKTAVHGRAWSSPVVADGEVWLTTATEDGKELSVLCVDLDTGEVVHDALLFQVEEPQFAHGFNSYASPSPVIDGDSIYVTFGSPGTARIRRGTKEPVWERRDLECDHFRGAGSSPVVFEDLVILTMDGADVQYVVALDAETGETRWRTPRSTEFGDLNADGEPEGGGDFRKGFSTPIVIEVDGSPQLVSPGAKAVFAYDPRTGRELWTVRYGEHSSSSRTLFGEGLVFVNTGFGRPTLLAIDPTGTGDVTATHVRWRQVKGVPQKPSPVLVDGRIHMVSEGGIATCLDARTGEVVWNERIGGRVLGLPPLRGRRRSRLLPRGGGDPLAGGRRVRAGGPEPPGGRIHGLSRGRGRGPGPADQDPPVSNRDRRVTPSPSPRRWGGEPRRAETRSPPGDPGARAYGRPGPPRPDGRPVIPGETRRRGSRKSAPGTVPVPTPRVPG